MFGKRKHPVVDGKKFCPDCDDDVNISEFYTMGVGKDGEPKYHTICKGCESKRAAKRHRDKYPTHLMDKELRKRVVDCLL